jgi:hypothetical protein
MSQVLGAFGLLGSPCCGLFSLGACFETYEPFISLIFKLFSGRSKPWLLNQQIQDMPVYKNPPLLAAVFKNITVQNMFSFVYNHKVTPHVLRL